MEKDRSRGLKHIKDKRKYKDNTTKNPKHVPPKQLPKLESNWDRYDKEDELVIGPDKSTDFSMLAKAPISKGNHFQFKSDKHIAEETDQAAALHDLFSLDLKAIQESILSIPFYERVQIDKSYFSETQLKYMESEAKDHCNKYQKHLVKNDKGDNKTDASGQLDEFENKTMLDEQIEKLNIIPQMCVTDECNVINKSTEEHKSEEDLEQWLDDILDE